jgi:hypothetical protein
VAGDAPAEAVDDDGLEQQRQLADARQHVCRAVVAPAGFADDATDAGRDWLGRAEHGGLLGGGDLTGGASRRPVQSRPQVR